MNEQLQTQLAEILATLRAGIMAAGDFAMAQLPDIAQQYVAWGRVYETLVLIAFVTLFVMALYVALRLGYCNRTGVVNGCWSEQRAFCAIAGTIASVTTGLIILLRLGGFLLVWFAPKVWLLKELATLTH